MPPMRIGQSILFAVTSVCFSLLPVKSYAEEKGPLRVSCNFFDSAVVSENVYIMVGDRGKIYRSKDAGTTWKAIEGNTKKALVAVCFPDDQDGWIAGQGGVILHSGDGGETWKAQFSGIDKYLLAVDFIDKNRGFAVGEDSTVVMTADGGQTWKRSPFGPPSDCLEETFNLFTVAMMDSRSACIAGDGGRVFVTQDAGSIWIEAKSPLYDTEMMEGRTLYSIVYDGGTLYGVGTDGALVYSKDRGHTWTEAHTGFSGPELYCIDMVDGRGMAAGSGGHIIKTSDGGSTWQSVQVPVEVTRFWFGGIDLHKTRSVDISGLIVGQNGTYGCLANGRFHWW